MPIPLYLDAARMGLMTPSARLALQDFVRLAGETSCTLYFEGFWKNGTSSWDGALAARFPGLQVWKGVRELKEKLSGMAGAVAECSTFLASRSTSLARRAISTLCQTCENVLVTDLTWPAYARMIRREAMRWGRRITFIRLRQAILYGDATPDAIAYRVISSLVRAKCDGAFFPEVSHDGIRLPIPDLCSAVREKSPAAKIVVDGAQAFAHIPINQSIATSDCYILGCHKWLGAHLPLGVAFCAPSANGAAFWSALEKTNDPLLDFVYRLETANENRFGETVNLTPLLTCRSALADAGVVEDDLAARLKNASLLCELLGREWKAILPNKAFRSGVVLASAIDGKLGADALRSGFASRGVMLTAYNGGIIRLSMPKIPFDTSTLELLANAFRAGKAVFQSSRTNEMRLLPAAVV